MIKVGRAHVTPHIRQWLEDCSAVIDWTEDHSVIRFRYDGDIENLPPGVALAEDFDYDHFSIAQEQPEPVPAKLPVQHFRAYQGTVQRGHVTVATCSSHTMAQRIANALNMYKPDERGR